MGNLSYEVLIYNHDGKRIHRIPRINDLRAKIIKNDFSTAMIALLGVDSEWALDYFRFPDHVNHVMQVRKNNPDTGNPVVIKSYFIRRFNPWVDENGGRIYHIAGVSPEWILRHRPLIPEKDLRYNAELARYIVEAGTTSDVMADLVSYHLGSNADKSRRYNVEIVKHGDVGKGGGKWDFDVLMDVIQDLAKSDDVDFNMEYIPENNLVQFHVGRVYRDRRKNNIQGNRPKILAERLGSLQGASLTYDAEAEKNVLWIRQDGKDDADRRLLLRIEGKNATTPWNAIEFEHNNTRKDESETNVKLITEGRTMLKENEPQVTLKMDFNNGLRNRFISNWLLGDRFTVEYANHEFDFEIASVDIAVSNGQENITPEIVMIDPIILEERNI